MSHLGVKWTTKKQLMKIDAFGTKASTLRPTLNLHFNKREMDPIIFWGEQLFLTTGVTYLRLFFRTETARAEKKKHFAFFYRVRGINFFLNSQTSKQT